MAILPRAWAVTFSIPTLCGLQMKSFIFQWAVSNYSWKQEHIYEDVPS